MNELIQKFEENRLNQALEKYMETHDDFELSDFLKDYAPEVFQISEEQYLQFLHAIDQEFVSSILSSRELSIENISQVEDVCNPMQIFEMYSRHLENPQAMDYVTSFLQNNPKEYSYDWTSIFSTLEESSLTSGQLETVLNSIPSSLEVDFPDSWLQNESYLSAILKCSQGNLSKENISKIPSQLINQNIDYFLNWVNTHSDGFSPNMTANLEFVKAYFQNVLSGIGNMNGNFCGAIDSSCFPYLEQNASLLLEKLTDPSQLFNNQNVLNSSTFLRLFWEKDRKQLSNFNRQFIAEELPYLYEHGFQPKEDGNFLLESNLLVRKMIEYEFNNFGTCNILNDLEPSQIEQHLEFAFQHGYHINEKTPASITSKLECIQMAFRYHDYQAIDYTTIEFSDEDLKEALAGGYRVSKSTHDHSSYILGKDQLMKDYCSTTFSKEKIENSKVQYLQEKIGYGYTNLILEELLKDDQILTNFGETDILRMVKYVYFMDHDKELSKVVQNGQVSLLRDVMRALTNQEEVDIILMNEILTSFSDYAELCRNVLQGPSQVSDFQILRQILSVPKGLELTSLEDLRNYKQKVFEKNQQMIQEHSNDMLDVICKMLCGKNRDEVDRELKGVWNPSTIQLLAANIKDSNWRDKALRYSTILNWLESLFQLDQEKLRDLATRFNQNMLDNSIPGLAVLQRGFENMTKELGAICGAELTEKFTNFQALSTKEGCTVLPNKYQASLKTTDGIPIESREVDYIELEGMPFTTLAHVMNAYGDRSKLSDYKHPRMIGKTYICLSAINGEKFSLASSKKSDENHVTLLFSDFIPSQLLLAGPNDLGSDSRSNNLSITYDNIKDASFAPVAKNIHDTSGGSYNEYVMYREDQNGKNIYPSGILIRGKEPTQEEINAAAYLNVPVVKINEQKYFHNQVTWKTEIEPSLKEKFQQLRSEIVQIDQLLGNQPEIVEEEFGKAM